jgi:hypothetical protein
MFDKKKMQDFTEKYSKRVKEKPVSSLSLDEVQHAYTTLIEVV